MSEMDLRLTPLSQEHKKLGARFAPFAGWLMPVQYAGIIAEHNWTRQRASVFDIFHMGEFIIDGESKRANLERILTVDLDSMPNGACRYGFMLNEKGGIIDDLLVYRLKQDRWMLVVNAATIDKDEAHLKRYLSDNSKIENVSNITGKLDLQGPDSQVVLKQALNLRVENLKYYTFGRFSILGEDSIVSRTGYTGELGYEIYLSNGKIENLWSLLLKDKRVRPAGLGARDTLRLEMGYSLYGQDINEEITPLQAGLERFIDFNKDFIGKDALTEQKNKGIATRRIYFIADSRRAPRHNYRIYSNTKDIGVVTSGSFSPGLSRGIGMGYIKSSYEKIGSKVALKGNKTELDAAITNRPFYKTGSVK